MTHAIGRILAVAALAYVGVGLLLFFKQRSYIYFPSRTVRATPAELGLPYEEISLTAQDGIVLAAWLVKAESGADAAARPTGLFCHGNGGNIGDRLATLQTFAQMGFDTLIFDYHGYGASEGKPGEEETYRGALAAWKYLTETRQIPPARILLFGRSLGGAVAAWLATQEEPGLLVMESTFTSIPAMAATMYPVYPTRWLSRFSYDTLARMPEIRCPVIVAHSREDEMIPFQQGRALYKAAREPKLFFELQGSHNAGGLDIAPGYRDQLRAWARHGRLHNDRAVPEAAGAAENAPHSTRNHGDTP